MREYTSTYASRDDATLTVSFENHGTVGPQIVDGGCNCDPLNMIFSALVFPDQGSECDGAIRVFITE